MSTDVVSRPRWLTAVLYGQVAIGAVALAIVALVVLGVRPLLQQRYELSRQVTTLRAELKTTNDNLAAVQRELTNEREALNAPRDGINAYHRGDYAAAVEQYDSVLRVQPENPYLLDLKGYSQFKAGNIQESIATLQQSVQADPNYALWTDNSNTTRQAYPVCRPHNIRLPEGANNAYKNVANLRLRNCLRVISEVSLEVVFGDVINVREV